VLCFSQLYFYRKFQMWVDLSCYMLIYVTYYDVISKILRIIRYV